MLVGFISSGLCTLCGTAATVLLGEQWLCEDCTNATIEQYYLNVSANDNCWPSEPIGDCKLCFHPAWSLDEQLKHPLCPDHKHQEREWIQNRNNEAKRRFAATKSARVTKA